MGYLEHLWNKLEIRVLVISSLGLQIFLLAIAGLRKHVISIRWAENTRFTFRGPLPFLFHSLLWLAYLLADYVATVALAYVRGSEISKATQDHKTKYLLVFWAPFFVLHLGGQDTITALSVEDNELWARHMLIFLSQVGLAMYNYFSSNLRVGELWPPAVLMFGVAIFKYGERVLSLQRASMSSLRSSLITKPDPGPNYAKFMQEYTSSNEAGLVAVIKVENEKHKDKGEIESHQAKDQEEWIEPDYAGVVCKAYDFFKTFKRLFVDLILSYKDRDESQKYFAKLQTNHAYNLIEIELCWMYEILHSKGSIIYSKKHYGLISRVITLIVIIIALCLFVKSDHTGYGRFETILTYVLLGGAVSLEIIAIIFIFLSFWTYASMKDCWYFSPFSKFLFSIMKKMRPENKPRWSNRMAQYSLITYSLEDKPRWWKSIMKSLGLKKSWDEYRYTTCATVNDYLKELVFQELKKKMNNIDDPASYRRFTDHRGQWALQRKGYYQEFGWSVEAEFDESILLWHIATDLLFHVTLEERKQKQKQKKKPEPKSAQLPEQKTGLQPESQSEPQSEQNIIRDNNLVNNSEQEKKWNREISQDISNYVLFLLIVRPFMMPAGIGQIRFGDTCAEAANFLQPLGEIEKRNLKNIAGKKNTDKVNNNKDDVKHGNLKNVVGKENTEKGKDNEIDVEHGTVGVENTEKGNTETGNTEKGGTEMGNAMKGNLNKKSNAVKRLLEVNTKYDPQLIKGDRSKSVLFKGCRLAHQLKEEFTTKGESEPDWDKMWRLISVVWVEILCYAASKCSGQFHAKQLSKGGELLTVIWFLMAHLGMGEQYRIEEGHARAKLIVSK